MGLRLWGRGCEIISFAFRFWWRRGLRLWVLYFGGVSDEEREMERWTLAVARRLWVEADGGGEALHHGIVRERDKE